MKGALTAIGMVIAIAVTGVFVRSNTSVPSGVTLHIRSICIPITSPAIVVVPSDESVYYTNNGGTNIVLPGPGLHSLYTGLVGPAAEVYWDMQPGAVYLQTSKDLTNWSDIRVALIGVSNYFTKVEEQQCFYRLRLGQQ